MKRRLLALFPLNFAATWERWRGRTPWPGSWGMEWITDAGEVRPAAATVRRTIPERRAGLPPAIRMRRPPRLRAHLCASPAPQRGPVTTTPANLDEYLATLTPGQRAVLEELRATIRAAAPGADEGFSYRMPLFTLDGKPLVWYAAWKRHYSLYPIGAAVLRAHAAEVEGYETGRRTIRFPASKPLPFGLVRKLVQARIAEVTEHAG
jgi:uncharacterized protein YdhG (YjbR/CyaY superfamily)